MVSSIECEEVTVMRRARLVPFHPGPPPTPQPSPPPFPPYASSGQDEAVIHHELLFEQVFYSMINWQLMVKPSIVLS